MKKKMLLIVLVTLFSPACAQDEPGQKSEEQDVEELVQQQCNTHPVLYAPWRTSYTLGSDQNPDQRKEACAFCAQFALNSDEKFLIVARPGNFVVMLSAYPYGKGHMLLLPRGHHATIGDLSAQERADLMELANVSRNVLKETMKPDGINVGINEGKAGGASIPGHLHMHILPRWRNAEGAISMLSQARVIVCDIPALYAQLKTAFSKRLGQRCML